VFVSNRNSLKSSKNLKNHKFYWDDSGKNDKNKIIVFTTKRNLELLDLEYHDQWLGDGTFDIAPTFFKQVYSIHILANGRAFPMVYGFYQTKNKQLIKYSLK